jgi:hypothetical protein
VAEDADPDGDLQPNGQEFLRDTDPLSAAGRKAWEVRYGGDDREGELELTLILPIAGGFVAEGDGSVTSRYGRLWDRVRALTELDGPGAASGAVAVEELPSPRGDGLGALSPFHQYRTVRRPDRPRGVLLLQTGLDPAGPILESQDPGLPSQAQ